MAELELGWPKRTKMPLTADYELSLFGLESPEQVRFVSHSTGPAKCSGKLVYSISPKFILSSPSDRTGRGCDSMYVRVAALKAAR